MRRSAPLLLLAAGALAAPARAPAWSDPGHRMIGAIAELRLGPAARRLVAEVIGGKALSDRDVATWADTLRDERTRPWHYVNVPYAAERYDAARDCPRGCAVSALETERARLRDATDSLALADSLRWLVHLAGDLHQPFHAGEARDRGGNDTWLRVGRRRQPVSLHRLWDKEVLAPLLRGRDAARAARELSARVTPAQAAAWTAELSPASWADESHRLARTLHRELLAAPRQGDRILLPAGWIDSQRPRVEEALQRAGVRLAALLDRVAAEREARRPGR